MPRVDNLGAMPPEEREREIRAALYRARGNVTVAATKLACSRPNLWHHLRKLKLGHVPAAVRAAAARAAA